MKTFGLRTSATPPDPSDVDKALEANGQSVMQIVHGMVSGPTDAINQNSERLASVQTRLLKSVQGHLAQNTGQMRPVVEQLVGHVNNVLSENQALLNVVASTPDVADYLRSAPPPTGIGPYAPTLPAGGNRPSEPGAPPPANVTPGHGGAPIPPFIAPLPGKPPLTSSPPGSPPSAPPPPPSGGGIPPTTGGGGGGGGGGGTGGFGTAWWIFYDCQNYGVVGVQATPGLPPTYEPGWIYDTTIDGSPDYVQAWIEGNGASIIQQFCGAGGSPPPSPPISPPPSPPISPPPPPATLPSTELTFWYEADTWPAAPPGVTNWGIMPFLPCYHFECPAAHATSGENVIVWVQSQYDLLGQINPYRPVADRVILTPHYVTVNFPIPAGRFTPYSFPVGRNEWPVPPCECTGPIRLDLWRGPPDFPARPSGVQFWGILPSVPTTQLTIPRPQAATQATLKNWLHAQYAAARVPGQQWLNSVQISKHESFAAFGFNLLGPQAQGYGIPYAIANWY